MKKSFEVTGMTCSACSSHVEKSVRKLQGVAEVSVNLLQNRMQVEYDDKALTEAAIMEAVEKAGYGACPLEPASQGKAKEARRQSGALDQELASMRRRLWVSIAFLIPLMYISMGHMMGLPLPGFFHGAANAVTLAFTQLLLTLPILYVHRKYYQVGFKTLLRGAPNMDSLIAIGSSAAVVYGLVAIYAIGWGLGHGDMQLVEQYSMDLYFESAGTIVTLLLGMDGSVVDVLTGTSVEAVYYGMVESSEKVVAEDGNAAVQTNVTVLCTDGTAKTFAVDKAMDYKAGRLVSVNVSEGSVTIKTLTEKHTSGKVNSTATKLGDLSFADNVEILDTSSEGTAAAVDASRLSGMSLDSDDIRYYGLNEEGRIEYLILDDVTGDLWTYAYLTDLEDQSQEMSINVTYTYLVDGTEQTLRSASVKYPVETGGIAIAYKSDGSIQTMQRMKSVKLTELSGSWAMASNQRYAIADDVQVYLRKNGSYYLTALSAVNAEDYTLTGWYNNSSSSAGRQIRIIIATALES